MAADRPALVVADVGNTRIKCAILDPEGQPGPIVAASASGDFDLPGLAPKAPPPSWAFASVNPPAADRLARRIEAEGGRVVARYDRAADFPIRSDLEAPESAGADRAAMVLAALERHGRRGPGLVVSVGTAVTIERIAPDGTWQGGTIGPGLRVLRAALKTSTAQLPDVGHPLIDPTAMPPAWGRSTGPAILGGTAWGLVGIVRELLARVSDGFDATPWVLWTGGDGRAVADQIEGESAEVVPDLVLRGVALAAFGPSGGSP